MMPDLKRQIIDNAGELRRLHGRIQETSRLRGQSPEKLREWEKACKDFHSAYDRLAFPGGYGGAPERIVAGDPEAMEAAICFLECRPYFFRSGYMFKVILRKAKHAPLSKRQVSRLQTIIEHLAEWKRNKANSTDSP